MQEPEHNDQEDHLEEGDEEVTRGEGEPDHPEDGRDGALDDGQAEGVERGPDAFAGSVAFLRQVVVADVSREVDGEADAHDQVDQGHSVQSNSPPRHVPEERNFGN